MKIVVPLDLSDVAERAVPIAADIAAGLGDEVMLVTVMGQRLRADLAEVSEVEHTSVPEMIEAYLKSAVSDVDGVSAAYTVITGDDASEALVDFARGESIRMIVMATHGRSGIERWRLGSVTERVVRHSEVPVLVVPTRRPGG